MIVPTLTWVSDIASVLQCGMTPVFCDIDRRTLGMDEDEILRKITPRTKAVFLTHVLGYNALSPRLLNELAAREIPLIEDVCESHGATLNGRRLGSFGLVSNFSFYYAHHLSTIEGGMVCTNDSAIYETVRMLRSHGMVREATSPQLKESYAAKHADLNPDFIFAYPAYNVRSTELNAVIGRSQLARLDENNKLRTRNLELFLDNLDPSKYQTDFATEGKLQLCLHAGPARAESRLVPERDARAQAARRRIPPRAVRRRQPGARSRTSASSSAQTPGKNFRRSIMFISTASISGTIRDWKPTRFCNCASCSTRSRQRGRWESQPDTNCVRRQSWVGRDRMSCSSIPAAAPRSIRGWDRSWPPSRTRCGPA